MKKENELEEILMDYDHDISAIKSSPNITASERMRFCADRREELGKQLITWRNKWGVELLDVLLEGYKRYLKDKAGFKGKVCALLVSNGDSDKYCELVDYVNQLKQQIEKEVEW